MPHLFSTVSLAPSATSGKLVCRVQIRIEVTHAISLLWTAYLARASQLVHRLDLFAERRETNKYSPSYLINPYLIRLLSETPS